MKSIVFLSVALLVQVTLFSQATHQIFDVHLHGSSSPQTQFTELKNAGVYKVALSTSWDFQQEYEKNASIQILNGLMFPCPEGKVPYSLQNCFSNGQDFPDLAWVEQLIKENKIQFLGEILSQYYGISPSDEKMFPYYALAEKYGLPVGIHTGLAGPNHGSPDFKIFLGKPLLLETLLQKFPNLKIWIMHAGAPFMEDTIAIMKYFPNVYADISAINNPYIFPKEEFSAILKRLVEAGLEDRLMFGSDNGEIETAITNLEELTFLSEAQKQKIFFQNAERFFSK